MSLLQKKIYKLTGKVQHYAWGGDRFIPELLHIENTENKPCAEYWLGAHPSAPSTLHIEGESKNLHELIQQYSSLILSKSIQNKFGELPYLYKVLDVKDMLSIQVHPSKEEAIKGFEREEAADIPLNAANRNYKDKNHKPEVMIALGEFWLLHGFLSLEEIERRLTEIKEFNVLLHIYKREGLKSLYQFLMEMTQEEVDSILVSLVKREMRKKQNGDTDKSQPGWWVSKLYKEGDEIKNVDKGVFSIYLFNIVCLQKGEGIFQSAGIPHAYLEGQNIELMANSDNVLRGGLTPKHIDVTELLKHTIFEPVVPKILKGSVRAGVERLYDCPVDDFDIAKINLNVNNSYTALSASPEIFIVMDGGAVVNGNGVNFSVKRGDSFIVFPNENYSISSSGNCELYKAFVS
ncbi:MAG: mannose-6-phosphate isomerase, class I [Chitinophagaceae bacterium]|nr:mannose-6-phosphate isomerase, class I [Chitinophagaceae bacterium]